MTLQKQAYLSQGLGKVGTVSRQNPTPQSLPAFVEGKDLQVGRFVFKGTNGNQVKATGNTGDTPEGVAIFEGMQLNFEGQDSLTLIETTVIQKLLKGFCFMQCDGGDTTNGNYVLVDPTTGDVFCDASNSKSAGAGKEVFANVNTTVSNWTSITAGALTVNIDGTDTSLTSLDFSSATSMANVASVISTALGSGASASYDADTGLTITSASTGSTSVIEVVTGDDALLALLGTGALTKGNNALNDSGWKVNQASIDNKIIEAYKL